MTLLFFPPIPLMSFRSLRVVSRFCLGVQLLAVVALTDEAAAQVAAPRRTTADSAQLFYFSYRKALPTTKTLADLRPWMTAEGYLSASRIPAEQQPTAMRTLLSASTAIDSVVVLDRVASADTVVLRLRGIDRRDRETMQGAAIIVRQAGTWKIGREEWQSTR